jgi:multidrug efflux pump subunit AcrA (membrane-fusion protein)
VSYIELQSTQLKPEIIGYGTVKPDLGLQAKAEVTGRVTYINPKLKKGEIFNKGTILLQIDDKDYQLQLKQAEADLISTKAKLKEMETNIDNNKLDLSIAAEKLKVREKEYARLAKLRKAGSVSQSSLEKEKQNLLQQKQEMQQLKNKQTTLPSQLDVLKAQIDISQAKLQKSVRDLERTTIRLPFNGRINDVFTELDQFVATGAPLFNAFGLEKIIINAQFPIDQFRLFAKSLNNKAFTEKSSGSMPSMTEVLQSFGLSATVEIAGGDFKNWTAKVERFSDNLDPQSRTVGVIVSVQDSYKHINPGSSPPLLEGMYMKVFLQGKAIDVVAFPRYSLHENQVYMITKDNMLRRLSLNDIKYQGSLVLIDSQLKTGDRIITSDIFPAVDGMSLTPILDDVTTAQMIEWVGADK